MPLQAQPFRPQMVQAERPHTGMLDWIIARKSRELWVATMGTARSIVFPSPDVAPTAVISNVDTAYPFKMIDGTEDPVWALPWFAQKRFTVIECQVWVASSLHIGGSDLGIRLKTDTLVSAVTQKITPYTEIPEWRRAPNSNWHVRVGAWFVGSSMIQLVPTYTADRRMVLKLDAAWLPTSSDLSTVSSTRTVKLYAIRIRDKLGLL